MICGVSESFFLSRKTVPRKTQKKPVCRPAGAILFHLREFWLAVSYFLSSLGSLSPSGFFALSAVFIRLYRSLRFTVIAYVNDRNEKIKKKDYRRAKKACVYLSL